MIPENQKKDPPVNQRVQRSPPVEAHTGDKTGRPQVRQADQDTVNKYTTQRNEEIFHLSTDFTGLLVR